MHRLDFFGLKKNGWKNAAKKPCKNAELWQRLDTGECAHQVTWEWVQGHAGQSGKTKRADETGPGLAMAAVQDKMKPAHPLGVRLGWSLRSRVLLSQPRAA